MIMYMSEITVLDLIGILGVAFYVGNYLLVSLGRSSSHSIGFYVRSGTGAICVLISLCEDFNIASAMIQILFIVISLFGITSRLRRPRPSRSASSHRISQIT